MSNEIGGVHTRKAVCTQGRRCAHKEGGVHTRKAVCPSAIDHVVKLVTFIHEDPSIVRDPSSWADRALDDLRQHCHVHYANLRRKHHSPLVPHLTGSSRSALRCETRAEAICTCCLSTLCRMLWRHVSCGAVLDWAGGDLT